MPGFFNTMGTYMPGMVNRGISALGTSGMVGAGMGSIYGAMSNDTSVLGGATMGAAAGVGFARYGLRPAAAVNRLGLGSGMGFRSSLAANSKAMASAMTKAAFRDARGAKMAANHLGSRIRGLYR